MEPKEGHQQLLTEPQSQADRPSQITQGNFEAKGPFAFTSPSEYLQGLSA